MTRAFGLLLALLTAITTIAADQPDEVYIRIYRLIDKGDTLSASGQTAAAISKYEQAQTNLLAFKSTFPSWNEKVVSYRLNYLKDKIATLSKPPPAPAPAAPPTAPPGETAAPAAEKTEAKPVAAPTPQATIQVKLLEPGAEPRQALRLHPKVGDKQSVVVTIKNTMDMGTGQSMKMPAIKMPMDVVISAVSPDGQISYETTFGDATLADEADAVPQVAEAMKTSLQGLKGTVISGKMSDRGIPSGAKSKTATGGNPHAAQITEQMKDAMSSLGSPLPEEAVGVGAKWEVKQPIKAQGMTIAQTANLELVSINDGRLELKTSITQNAANQKLENPAMPGVKVDLTKMTGSAKGTATSEVTRLFPTLASLDGQSEIAMNMNMGSKKQAMTMKTETSVRIESK